MAIAPSGQIEPLQFAKQLWERARIPTLRSRRLEVSPKEPAPRVSLDLGNYPSFLYFALLTTSSHLVGTYIVVVETVSVDAGPVTSEIIGRDA
jgi:hypothetical protein